MRNHRTPEPDAARDEVTTLFPVLGQMWRRRGGDLLGRAAAANLAIARALAPRPKLLILDEPTEGVQPSIVEDHRARHRRLSKGAHWRFSPHARANNTTDFSRVPSPMPMFVLDRGRVAARAERAATMEADGVSAYCRSDPERIFRMTVHHHVDLAAGNTLFWGLFRCHDPPVIEIDSGDEVTALDCLDRLPPRRTAAGAMPTFCPPTSRPLRPTAGRMGRGSHFHDRPRLTVARRPGLAMCCRSNPRGDTNADWGFDSDPVFSAPCPMNSRNYQRDAHSTSTAPAGTCTLPWP